MPQGPRVVNTRPSASAAKVSAMLRAAGFTPVEIPLMEPVLLAPGKLPPPPSGAYTGLFLSSAAAVDRFREALDLLAARAAVARNAGDVGKIEVAGDVPKAGGLACGEKTRASVAAGERLNLRRLPLFTPSERAAERWRALGGDVAFLSRGRSVTEFLLEIEPGGGGRWLHPCSVETRLEPGDFSRAGVEVANWSVYAPALPEVSASLLQAEFDGARAFLFFSGSAAERFFDCLKGWCAVGPAVRDKLCVASGESARAALVRGGAGNVVLCPSPEPAAVVAVLRELFFQRP